MSAPENPGPLSLSDLLQDERNINRGNPRGNEIVRKSIRRNGGGRSILLDSKNRIIAGNKTHKAALEEGLDLLIVPTNGHQLVAVKRTDLDLERDPEARELAFIDNMSSQLNWTPDPDIFAEQRDQLALEEYEIADSEVIPEPDPPRESEPAAAEPEATIQSVYNVVVECANEEEQQETYERLRDEGYSVRLQTIKA